MAAVASSEDAPRLAEEAELNEEVDDATTAAGKRKKKNKKKAAADHFDGEPLMQCSCPDAELAEEEEVDIDESVGAAGKKKKKKKKKAAALPVSSTGDEGCGVWKYCSDEDYEVWVKSTLECTKNESEGMRMEDQLKPPKSFWGYSYSGPLRPALVTKQRRMPSDFLMPDYALHEQGHSLFEVQGPKEIPILEGEKLAIMREACRLGREVLDIAARYMQAGTTGDDIDRIVYQACVDRRIYPSPLNYYKFPKSVCVSPNEVICHGIPDRRPIEEGDIVNLDVSIFYKGFHSDLNETFFIGQCCEDSHRLVRTAYNCLHAAATQIHPGFFYRDLGNYIHQEAAKNGCAVVASYSGHGVGEMFHGPPKVPHYRKNKAVGIMKPGHVFTVEPMINLGTNGGDKTWPDNWTAVTKDGKRSAQFEHTFLVTDTGYEVLTARGGTDVTAMPSYNPAMFQR